MLNFKASAILVNKFPDDFAFMCRQIILDYDQPSAHVTQQVS
jgi:hypothetical protein